MVVLIGFAWIAVTAWYAVILAVVGPIVAPFWLIRWGDRRREFREQQEDAALLRMMTGGSKNDLQ
jgi:Flp pilus assembly protein TadB